MEFAGGCWHGTVYAGAMEHNEISTHELAIVKVLRDGGKWLSNEQILRLHQDGGGFPMSDRTVRAKTLKLVGLGLIDQAEVFPSHKYRWSAKAKQRNAAYLLRLERAAEVMAD